MSDGVSEGGREGGREGGTWDNVRVCNYNTTCVCGRGESTTH